MTARTSRRDLFGAGASLMLLTAAAAGTAKAQELDGELLAASAEALVIDRHTDRLEAAWDADALEVHMAAADVRFMRLVQQLTVTRARTPEGLRAKAEIARRALPKDCEDDGLDLAKSVLADLLHGLGTAKLSGDFAIEGETVKWIADQIKPISRVVMNQHHLLMGNDGAASA